MKPIFVFLIVAILFACTPESDVASSSNNATNSSYSTVLVVGDRLYGVSDNYIATVDISDKENVQVLNTFELGFDIESIFHFEGILLVGSASSMYILEISENGIPLLKSTTVYNELFNDCRRDPIIARDTFAYVTLSNDNVSIITGGCDETINFGMTDPQLRVYSIKDLENPRLLSIYPMHNPKGLAFVNDSLIAIAEDDRGIKVLDISNYNDIHIEFEKDDFDANDIIIKDDVMIVVGKRDLTQFDVSAPPAIGYLSGIVLK